LTLYGEVNTIEILKSKKIEAIYDQESESQETITSGEQNKRIVEQATVE
jgi:hypothetical protein